MYLHTLGDDNKKKKMYTSRDEKHRKRKKSHKNVAMNAKDVAFDEQQK